MRKTKVLFVKEDEHVLAVFPEEIHANGQMTVYSHVGQHSMATKDYYKHLNIIGDPARYADLKKELESIGYNLRVMTE